MTVSRRLFLGGAASLIALPFLPSLVPRAARADGASPSRLIFLFAPNGVNRTAWRSEGSGTDYVPGPTLAQLDDVRGDLTVIRGLQNAPAMADGPGAHARGTGGFLTATRIGTSRVSNGESVDQVAARTLGLSTPFTSLELSVEIASPSVGVCDGALPCEYVQHVAWTRDTVPLPGMWSPRGVFNLLFGGADALLTSTEAARRKQYRLSVLDLVGEQAGELSRRAAVEDRVRLDQYLTAVRAVETRIGKLEACATLGAVPGDPELSEHADVLLELAVLAMQCDRTRVVTTMLGRGTSDLVYGFLGVRGAHHQLSHHEGNADNLAQLALIDAWQVGRFGQLVRALKAVPEGDGTMLDHSLVMMSSDISDGNLHNHDDLPVLLAGHLGGVAGGQLLDAPGAPLAGLYTSMLQAAGVAVDSFGEEAAGPLEGLLG